MSKFILPSAQSIQSVLTMIYGEEIAIEEPAEMDLASASHVGLFEASEGGVVGLCHCDLNAAASLSCALSLIPPGVAEEMIKDKSISEMAALNLNEVMNMFSSLYMDDNTDHLRFTELKGTKDLAEVTLTRRVDFELPKAKYPGGRVTFQAI